MLLLNKDDIKKIFTMEDAIEASKIAFSLTSQKKCEVPQRTVIRAVEDEGSFLFMPAYAKDLASVSLKIVNIFPNNAKDNLPTAPAQVLLIDGKTGMIQAIIDGTYLTQLRTGAASGLAFELLACQDAKSGCLIGTGSQAEKQLEAMLVTRKLEVVKVFSPNLKKAQSFVSDMQEDFKAYPTKIVLVESSDEAIEDADVIVCVTSSTKPVLDGTKVKEGATISCVGSYQPFMQEIDSSLLQRASKIYFDSKEMVLAEAGDIIIPMKEGLISDNDFTGEIGQVITNDLVGRENDAEIIVFETVGVASQDLVCAKMIYDKALASEIGVNWE